MPRSSDLAEASALLAALGLLMARCSWALSEAASPAPATATEPLPDDGVADLYLLAGG